MSIVHYVVLRKVEEMEIQTVSKENEEGRRSSSSVFFHRTFSYFYKFLLVNFNTIYFILLFIFASAFIIFVLFILFCHGDGYKHTHLTDIPLDEDSMIYQRSLAKEGEA